LRPGERISEHDAIRDDLRQHASSLLRERLDTIAGDASAIFPYSAPDSSEIALDGPDRLRIARLIVELLGLAIGDARLDGQHGFVAQLLAQAAERAIAPAQLFAFVHACERTALEELALDPDVGATSEAWPLVAQTVRRASFDAVAALAGGTDEFVARAAVIDPITTLPTRAVFEIALAKEVDRAGRFGDPLALIVVRLDRAGELEQQHGLGVAEKIVERLGVLVRGFFRRHDWVGRTSADAIGVVLTRSDAEYAHELAERIRSTVAQRLTFVDHRTGKNVPVTVSAAVIDVRARADTPVDAERLLAEADKMLSRTLPRNSPSA
jgi:diguanylate cyclase (GGDEF)-like protein